MDYALLALASIMGFGDGPWYLVIVIGILLTLLSSARHRAYAQRYRDFGAARVFAVLQRRAQPTTSFLRLFLLPSVAESLG